MKNKFSFFHFSFFSFNSFFLIISFLLLFFVSFFVIFVNTYPSIVLLSFDVEAINTPAMVNDILETLQKHNVSATFFVQGKYAETYSESVLKIQSSGHEIACHTYSHPDLTKLNLEQQQIDILTCNNIMSSLNISVKGFRAPYNRLNNNTFTILQNNYSYDASIIEGFSLFYPSPTLTEIKVSSLFFIPLEDVIFLYYFKIPSKIYYFLLSHSAETNSYLFHPQHITSESSLKYFSKFLNTTLREGSVFLTHEQYIKLI